MKYTDEILAIVLIWYIVGFLGGLYFYRKYQDVIDAPIFVYFLVLGGTLGPISIIASIPIIISKARIKRFNKKRTALMRLKHKGLRQIQIDLEDSSHADYGNQERFNEKYKNLNEIYTRALTTMKKQ